MPGTVAEFEDACPFDEGESRFRPLDPLAEGNAPRDRVVGEGQAVVEVVEEKFEQAGDQAHDIPHSVENCAFLEGGKRNSQPWVL